MQFLQCNIFLSIIAKQLGQYFQLLINSHVINTVLLCFGCFQTPCSKCCRRASDGSLNSRPFTRGSIQDKIARNSALQDKLQAIVATVNTCMKDTITKVLYLITSFTSQLLTQVCETAVSERCLQEIPWYSKSSDPNRIKF